MAQIGRQPDHLARRVLAGPVPVDHRAHGEGVAQVVDAWSPAMPLVLLFGSQADLLADLREVVTGAQSVSRVALSVTNSGIAGRPINRSRSTR